MAAAARALEYRWLRNRGKSTVPREEVRGHGAIQVREVWEDVSQSWQLLRGAHEGGQVVE